MKLFDVLVCTALDVMGCFIGLRLHLPSELHAPCGRRRQRVAGPHRWHHAAHEITALSRARMGRWVLTPSWVLPSTVQQFHHSYNTSCLRTRSRIVGLRGAAFSAVVFRDTDSASSEKLTAERPGSLISTVFTELEKVSHSWCAKVSSLASKCWRSIPSAVGELLDSQTSARQSSVLGSCWRKRNRG